MMSGNAQGGKRFASLCCGIGFSGLNSKGCVCCVRRKDRLWFWPCCIYANALQKASCTPDGDAEKQKKRQERESVCPSKEEISKISRNPPGSWEMPETPMIQDKGWLDLIQLPLKSLGGLSFQRYARNVGVLDVTRRVSGNGNWRCPTRGTSPACDVNADGNPKTPRETRIVEWNPWRSPSPIVKPDATKTPMPQTTCPKQPKWFSRTILLQKVWWEIHQVFSVKTDNSIEGLTLVKRQGLLGFRPRGRFFRVGRFKCAGEIKKKQDYENSSWKNNNYAIKYNFHKYLWKLMNINFHLFIELAENCILDIVF